MATFQPRVRTRTSSADNKRRVLFDGQSFNYVPQYSIFDPDSEVLRTRRRIYPARLMSGKGHPWGIVGVSGIGYHYLLNGAAHNIQTRVLPAFKDDNFWPIFVLCGGQSDIIGYANYNGVNAPQTGLATYNRAGAYAAALRNLCVDNGLDAQAVICTTIPPGGDAWYPDEVTYNSVTYYIEQNRQDFNTQLLADTFGYFDDVVDLGTIDLDPADDLHPSAQGAYEIAAAVEPVLEPFLA